MVPRLRYPLLFILAFILAWTCSLSLAHSFDIFWHLAMFRDFWESGLSPFYDHLTYTFDGQPLSGYPPVPFQALAYALTEWMGVNVGIQATKAFAFWITLFAWFCICQRFRWGIWVSVLGTIFLLGALQARAIARPEILIYPFLLLISAWALAYRNRSSYRSLWVPSALLIAASMIHSGVSICYLVAGTYSFGRILDGLIRRDRSLLRYGALSGLLFLMIGFLNPDLENVFVQSVLFWDSGDAVGLIREYRAPESRQMFALFIFAPAALWCVPRWLHERQWIPLLLLGGFGYLSVTMVRAIPWVIIVTLPWVCLSLASYERRWRDLGRHPWIRVMVVICGVAWWFHPGNHLRNPSFGVLLPIRYPVGLEHSLNRTQGNIYALFHLGGYISYFHPQLKTHQDGRSSILFPLEAVAENMQAARSRQVFSRVTSTPVAADFVLSQNDESILPELAAQDGRYVIEDADQFFLLFRRGGGRYPLATELLARPQCWAGNSENLEAELSKFLSDEANIPATFSKRLRGLSLVEALHRAVLALDELEVDGAGFPPAVELSFRKHYRVARTLAWIAGSRSMHKTAVALFENMSHEWYRGSDLQAYAASLIAAGLAESMRERLLQMSASEEATSDFSVRVIGALDAEPNSRAVFACEQSSDGLAPD